MQWYYVSAGQRQGPFTQTEFDALISNATVKPDTLVWHEGMKEWQPYGTVASSGAVPAATTAAADDTEVCAFSGKRYPRREMIQYEGKWISAEHRDAYFQHLREGVVPAGIEKIPGPYGYGGFWRRFIARFVDGILLGVIGFIIGMIGGAIFVASGVIRPGNTGAILLMQLTLQAIQLTLAISYSIFFIRKFDATPGKMAMGLKLFRVDGEKLSVLRIIGREFSTFLSALILLIGYIMAAFDPEKRALHDRICDTRVVRTRA